MIANLTNKKYIARNPFFAVGFCDRIRGMIGRKFYESDFDAMVFTGCNAIHTCFMGQKIDVIFLDAENKVVGLRKNLARWRMAVRCPEAVTTIELPEGVIEHTGTEMGHVVNVSEEAVPELSTQTAGNGMVQELESVVHYKASDK
jgi:hypothetical protein